MPTKKPAGIRASYTPLERALLAAYLKYPDPCPSELEGIDVDEPVDPYEWDEKTRGLAPHISLFDSDHLMLENAVARICLAEVDARLPQWALVSKKKIVFGRSPRGAAGATRRAPDPLHLFTINWADSGPGCSWPEAYYVTRLAGYDVCIVTASADSPDTHGYCDCAVGWYLGEPNDQTLAGEQVRRWWAWQRDEASQGRWAYLFDAGTVSGVTAERWADAVWPPFADRDILSEFDDDEDDIIS